MNDPILIDIVIAEPILLDLVLAPEYYIGTAQAGPSWTIGIGDKLSAVDAGEFGQVSLGDDYIYFCTAAGTAGNAIWKKTVLFQT